MGHQQIQCRQSKIDKKSSMAKYMWIINLLYIEQDQRKAMSVMIYNYIFKKFLQWRTFYLAKTLAMCVTQISMCSSIPISIFEYIKQWASIYAKDVSNGQIYSLRIQNKQKSPWCLAKSVEVVNIYLCNSFLSPRYMHACIYDIQRPWKCNNM